MAYLCTKPKGSCAKCRHYRMDEDMMRMACFAQRDTGSDKKLTDEELLKLWEEFADVPFDETPEGEMVLAVDWNGFPKGTEREEIWHWFDELYSKGVAALLYGE